MASSEKKVKAAYLIAAAGLVLAIVSLIIRQPLGTIIGGVITFVFVVCVFVIERGAKR